MQKDVKDRDYQTEDGQTTKFQVETYKQEGQDPIVVVRNAPDNEGQPFGQDVDKRNEVTLDQADRIDKDFNCYPEQQIMYQERPNGNFDEVTFKAEQNKEGNLVWQENREEITPPQLEERLNNYEQKQGIEDLQAKVDQHHQQLYEQGELTKGVPDIEKDTANQTQQQQDEISRQERQRTQGISR